MEGITLENVFWPGDVVQLFEKDLNKKAITEKTPKLIELSYNGKALRIEIKACLERLTEVCAKINLFL